MKEQCRPVAMKKVFLGGTTMESKWREELKPLLTIAYFDPIVDDWNDEAQQTELYERKNSDFVLYVITPRIAGVFSIAELIDDSNKRPKKTLFCYLLRDGEHTYDEDYIYSLKAVAQMVKRNGGKVFDSLVEIANYLNAK